jgi:hypothetical protein
MSEKYAFVKRLIYTPHGESGEQLIVPIQPDRGVILKLAYRQDLLPKVAEFISKLRPGVDTRHVLVNALGAGEYYGSNRNGDFFAETALSPVHEEHGHKTFLKAGLFRHHANRDISKSSGKVEVSEYNPHMHRVELILRFEREKDPDVFEMIDGGQLFPLSMGCRVKKDVCSVCGHESKTTSDYCDHLMNMMNEILDDGRRVCALNPEPKFFDISRVLVGADKTARSYGKLASVKTCECPSWYFMPSGLLAIKLGDVKSATIDKEITVAPTDVDVIDPVKEKAVLDLKKKSACLQGHLDTLTLQKAAYFRIPETLSSFAVLGIPFSAEEFQYVVLANSGHEKLAEQLHSLGCTFIPVNDSRMIPNEFATAAASTVDVSVHNVNPLILKLAAPHIKGKSVLPPFVTERALKLKTAWQRCTPSLTAPIPLLSPISGLYSLYLDKLASFGPTGIKLAGTAIPDVKYLLYSIANDSLDLAHLLNEKRASDDSEETIKDYLVGTLLTPRYKGSLDMVKSTDPSHWKLASTLPELTPMRLSQLHPDTSAWVTVLTVNSLI